MKAIERGNARSVSENTADNHLDFAALMPVNAGEGNGPEFLKGNMNTSLRPLLIFAWALIIGSAGFHPRSFAQNCVAPPSGLVSWWGAEGNALDSADGNGGTLAGNTAYGPGRVGQAFVFDGSGDGVLVGNPVNLQLQSFTIEAWVKRADAAVVNPAGGAAEFFAYGTSGYAFGIFDDGRLYLTKVDVDAAILGTGITDTNFHHVAVTKSGTAVVFYIDGVPYGVPAYDTTFVFSSAPAIGARGDNLGGSFLGTIDEVSIYNRVLSAEEIQSLYDADGAGKCLIPPTITAQPLSQAVPEGDDVVFTVSAVGAKPLQYQWRFNGTDLLGETNATLLLENVQNDRAGFYSVVVGNSVGSVTSASGDLKVLPLSICTAPPSDLVSWWRAEGTALDQAGVNNGTLAGNTAYGPGRVGQAFVFDGSGDGVPVGNSASLQLQDFTIETWIKRADAAVVSTVGGTAEFFAYGTGGYAFGIFNNGQIYLTRVDIDAAILGTGITDTNFHHVAVTKSGTVVVFYIDGVPYSVPAYNTTFVFSSPAAVGARGDNLGGSFLGTIDELAIYRRALSPGEIQSIYTAGSAGKCPAAFAPVILSQPTNQTVLAGGSASFYVVAGGTPPLSYQWLFNGAPLAGQIGTSLTLSNVQSGDAGNYSVLVTNLGGPALSSNALLTVLVPQANCTAPPSGLVSWWRGESNALDSVDGNNGTPAGNTAYGPGRVGQAFVFDGSGDGVLVGNPANLQLQSFTIEAWVKRANAAVVNPAGGGAAFFAYGTGGYAFGLFDDGRLYLSKADIDATILGTGITDTNYHHLAVTKAGTTVVFYIDGLPYSVPAYSTTFFFSSPAAIGARGDNLGNSFLGTIDELSFYNRALSATEIQSIYTAGSAGKCAASPLVVNNPSTAGVLRCELKDGQLHLQFVGVAGQLYSVQASTNLVDWTVIGTAADLGGGIYEFVDTTWNNLDACFYRIVLH